MQTVQHRLCIHDTISRSFQNLKELFQYFQQALELASRRGSVVVFLDSLDQFAVEEGARKLAWLPRTLPHNVKIVVSTLPEEEYECFPKLKVREYTIHTHNAPLLILRRIWSLYIMCIYTYHSWPNHVEVHTIIDSIASLFTWDIRDSWRRVVTTNRKYNFHFSIFQNKALS